MHVGVIGCGQLARMLALAGIGMGIRFSFVNDNGAPDTACVDGLGKVVAWNSGDSASELYAALGKPDCITVEKEQVSSELLAALESLCPLLPNRESVEIIKDRRREKALVVESGIPTSRHVVGVSANEAVAGLGFPVVAKSCTEGYDGKNQWVIRTEQDAQRFDESEDPQNYIIEQFIPFDREVSLVAARNAKGEYAAYPLAENGHDQGILHQSIVPAPDISDAMSEKANDYMQRLMSHLGYVGVLAMELFVRGEDLLVNELAPRVHNSGHWSQHGADTCQFENHLRAICGMTLGSTRIKGYTGMINLLGCEMPALESIPANASLNWYGKSVRPGRKLGHVNFVDDDRDALVRAMNDFRSQVLGA
ncbi:MAG: 5-(carboxyamino)imidazole ribonucleotide synthase [Halioglobus sp.]